MASTLPTEQLSTETIEKQAPLLNDRNFFTSVIRKTVQDFLEAEMTSFIGAESRERTTNRQGFRSGHRPRTMNTRVGKLHFAIPCERSGQFHTRLFDNYQRSELAFVVTLQEMYLHGVSTRRVTAITEAMCSLPISSSL